MEGASSMFWALDDSLYALQKKGRTWSLMENSYALAKSKCSEGKNSIMDSTIIRAHRYAAGASKKGNNQALGRSEDLGQDFTCLWIRPNDAFIFYFLPPKQVTIAMHQH